LQVAIAQINHSQHYNSLQAWSGTVVTVTASPAAGYSFTGWNGDASGTNATTTVTMSANKSVSANFAAMPPTTYTLTTAASPTAGGTVSGAGVLCRRNCSSC
jgi:uncharacterized repeat protein (TIGR02543 family)